MVICPWVLLQSMYHPDLKMCCFCYFIFFLTCSVFVKVPSPPRLNTTFLVGAVNSYVLELENRSVTICKRPEIAQQLEKWWHHPTKKKKRNGDPVGRIADRLAVPGVDNKRRLSSFRLDGRHVVFGSVKEGMDVVKKVESFGSRSGRTSKRITITDCGELK